MKQSILRNSLILSLINSVVATLPAYSTDKQNTSLIKTAHTSVNSKKTVPGSKKLYGGIDQVNYALQAAGVTLESDRLPALVGAVRLGSPSHYAGLLDNDRILSANIVENKLQLNFERGGKRYAISLHTSPAILIPAVPKQDSQPLTEDAGKSPLISEISEADRIKQIAKYDIVMVIDISESMNFELAEGQESKWQWCKKFVSSFASKIIPSLNGRDITIVPFNRSYSINHERTPTQVLNFFESTQPRDCTDLGSPLQDVLKRFVSLDIQRPLLVMVLTDGQPNTGPKVEDVLIDASKHLKSENDVRILFLEVGEDLASNAYLRYLDDCLTSDGAKYDLVDVSEFKDLKNTTLVDAVQKAITQHHSKTTTKVLQIEIDRLKAEIEKQRKANSKSEREFKPHFKEQMSK